MVLYSETLKVHLIQEHRNSGTISSIQEQIVFRNINLKFNSETLMFRNNQLMYYKSFCQLRNLKVTFNFRNSEDTMVLFDEVRTLKLLFRSLVNQEHKVNHLLGTLNVSAARS